MFKVIRCAAIGLAAAASARAQPVNDNCVGAIPLGEGVTPLSFVDATLDASMPQCRELYDLWFTYTPAQDGSVFINYNDDTVFPERAGLFSNCATPQPLECNGNGSLSFEVNGGQTYLIRLAQEQPTFGTVELTYSEPDLRSYALETRWIAVATTAAQGAVGPQIAAGTVVDAATPTQIDVPSGPGIAFAQRFELQARSANVVDQNDGGVLAVRGDIRTFNAAGNRTPGLHNPSSAGAFTGLGDRPPYNFSVATERYRINMVNSTAVQVDEIFNASSDRDGFPQFTWTFNFDTGEPDPMPAHPPFLGVGPEWVSTYRVLVQASNPPLISAQQLRGIL